MSNLSFIIPKGDLSTYDVSSHLLDISHARFGNKLSVSCDPPNGIYGIDWISSDLKDADGFDIRVRLNRKLSIAQPDHLYTAYLAIVFKHELAKAMDAVLYDESDEVEYPPTPEKYSSYRKWIKLKYRKLQEAIDEELKLVPKGLEKF